MRKSILPLIVAGIITVPVFGVEIPNPDDLYNSDIYSMSPSDIRSEYEDLFYNYQVLYEEYMALANSGSEQQEGPEAKQSGLWAADYYRDEFNNVTDKAFIINTKAFEGTFSNSATTDDELLAYVYSEPNSVSFTLLEYKDSLVKGDYTDGETFTVNVLTPTGEPVAMEGYLYDGASGITLGNYSQRFNDILKQEGEVRVSMQSTRMSTTTYFFVIPAAEGFSNLYNETFGA